MPQFGNDESSTFDGPGEFVRIVPWTDNRAIVLLFYEANDREYLKLWYFKRRGASGWSPTRKSFTVPLATVAASLAEAIQDTLAMGSWYEEPPSWWDTFVKGRWGGDQVEVELGETKDDDIHEPAAKSCDGVNGRSCADSPCDVEPSDPAA